MITMTIRPDAPDQVQLVSDHSFRDRDRLLSIPGVRFDARSKQFVAPLTWSVCVATRGTFGEDLIVGEDVAQWAQDDRRTRIDPAMELKLASDFPGDQRLYDYQRVGVEYLRITEKAMLLDDMGTGKTIQTIMALKQLHEEGADVFPAIIVCPNNMKLTWQAELEKWFPGPTIAVVSGTAAVKRKVIATNPDILIVNWESMRTISRLDGKVSKVRLKRCHICEPTLPDDRANAQSKCERCPKDLNQRIWRTAVLDEVHRMKDPKAKQTRAVCAVRTDDTQFRFVLTGTIIGDQPVDMWPSLHFIAPKEFTSRTKYIERYCHSWYNYFGGLEIMGLDPLNQNEFFQIIDPLFRRVQKELVLKDLPPRIPSTRLVAMEPKQAKAYGQIEEEMLAVLDNGHIAVTNDLAKLTRLSQFSSAYGEIVDDNLVLTAPSNKVSALLEILEEVPATEQILVFAESRQLVMLAAKALEKAKISHDLLVGGQTDGQRGAVMADFQRGDTRVLLSTIKAGGTGITLTAASVVVFMQRSWSMIENQQAEARAHRIGSEHATIQIIDIISTGTLEEAQHAAIVTKGDNLQEILRDDLYKKEILNRRKKK